MRRLPVSLSIAGLLLLSAAAPAASENTCVFNLSLTSGTDINNLDLTVDYSATGGNVEGTPTNPQCGRGLGGQAFASFNDNDEASVLTMSVIRLSYFSAPALLAGCRIFYDSVPPVPGDFLVSISNAGRDGEDNNVVPKPTVIVTSVECPGQLPNGTTTTTTLGTGADRCGFPVTDGARPGASDALYVLRVAVGSAACDLCVCDINGSGGVAAGDALTILKAAVGIEIDYDCPPC